MPARAHQSRAMSSAVDAERAVVLGHRADPAEAEPRDAAQMLGDVKEQPVDGIEMLGDFLDHHHMAGQVGHQRRCRTASRA